MRTKDDIQVFLMMQRYGGSFVQKLGEACERADDDNLARIKAAFPELWDEYAEIAELVRQREVAKQTA